MRESGFYWVRLLGNLAFHLGVECAEGDKVIAYFNQRFNAWNLMGYGEDLFELKLEVLEGPLKPPEGV